MASPPFRSVGALKRLDGNNSFAIANAAGAVAGDLLVMTLFTIFSNQVNDAVANGWTQVQDYDPNNQDLSQYSIFWRIATGSEPSTYSVIISGGTGAQNIGDAQIYCYQGPINTPPVNVSAQANNATPTTSVAIPSLTTTLNDTTILALYGDTALSGAGTWGTVPSGMTQRTTTTSFAVADMAMPTAGATGAKTAPHSTSAPSAALIVAFSASQAADTVAPTATSASVASGTPTSVDIVMSEAMDTAVLPAASSVTVSGHTVTTLAWLSSTVLRATVSAGFVFGEAARTAAYTQPGSNNARDVATNLLANFSGLAITNNVPATDTVAPQFSSALVADGARNQIVITMGEALAAFTPATSAFAVSGGRTVTNVARSGPTITLTVDTPYAYGNTITATYTKPGSNMLQDAAGNQTANFGPSTVTNNIVAPAGILTSTPLVTNTTTGGVTTQSVHANEANWNAWATSSTSIGTPVGTVKVGLTTSSLGVLPACTDAAYVAGTMYIQHYGNTVTGQYGWQKITAT